MSFVLALNYNDKIYMMDSVKKKIACFNYNLFDEENSYIHKFGDIYVGYHGTLKIGQPMILNNERFENKKLSTEFLVKDLLPEYYSELKENGFYTKENQNEFPDTSTQFIFVQNKRIYFMDEALNIVKMKEFAIAAERTLGCYIFGFLDEAENKSDIYTVAKELMRNVKKRFKEKIDYYRLIDTETGKIEIFKS